MLRGMTTKKDTPDRMDVRVPEALKERLEARATQENRSRNAQAAHYIELGLQGLSPSEMARRMDAIESKLDELLRRLDRK